MVKLNWATTIKLKTSLKNVVDKYVEIKTNLHVCCCVCIISGGYLLCDNIFIDDPKYERNIELIVLVLYIYNI